MSKRDRKQAARKRGQARHQEQRRQAAASRRQVFDPATPPEVAAATLAEHYGDEPVDPNVARAIVSEADTGRALAIADAALARGRGPMALSLAADVALLDDRPEDAERYLVEARALEPRPDLTERMVEALVGQDRLDDALVVLDARIRVDDEPARFLVMQAFLLQEAHARGTAPRALARYRDRSALRDVLDAVERFIAADAERSQALASLLDECVEVGAVTRSELDQLTADAPGDPRQAALLRQLRLWAWSMPMPDSEQSLLEAFGESDAGTEDQRRHARQLEYAIWGLWEVARPVAAPGVFLEELVTGERVYVDVPEDVLAGLPRWSTLVGSIVPVDGTWRAGDWFEVASPVEARMLAHEVVDQILHQEKEMGRRGKPGVLLARRAHEAMGPFWQPGSVEEPSPEGVAVAQAVNRAMAPSLVAEARRMRGEISDDEKGSRFFTVAVADQDAAWEALTRQPGFTREDDGLAWHRERTAGAESDEPRAWIGFDEDGLGVEVEDRADLDELLRLMETIGHPPTAVEEPIDEAPEPPVRLPDLEGEALDAWLSEWPDEPLEGYDEAPTPRQLVEEDETEIAELLVRYLEHDADRRGVEVDTDAVRAELGLDLEDEGAIGEEEDDDEDIDPRELPF